MHKPCEGFDAISLSRELTREEKRAYDRDRVGESQQGRNAYEVVMVRKRTVRDPGRKNVVLSRPVKKWKLFRLHQVEKLL